MLIRSQDKMKIKSMNSLIEIYLIGSTVNIDGSTFGEYLTQEKAIKVLDMISEFYIRCGGTFQMPQDSEVK
jgi:hypothetical protein